MEKETNLQTTNPRESYIRVTLSTCKSPSTLEGEVASGEQSRVTKCAHRQKWDSARGRPRVLWPEQIDETSQAGTDNETGKLHLQTGELGRVRIHKIAGVGSGRTNPSEWLGQDQGPSEAMWALAATKDQTVLEG